jgi:uncharacterized protein (PEP-CTERM system associated)
MAALPALAMALAASMPAAAQSSAPSLVPSVGVTLTATDNRDLSSTRPQADLVTVISPGITLTSRRGPLQGSLNYALSGIVYARDSSRNAVRHNLAANGRWSLLEGRAGVDATANVGRQVVSAFGTQSPDANLGRDNQAQVVSVGLSPHLAGSLWGNIGYHARLSFNESRSDSSGSAGDARSLDASVGIGGQQGMLGWGVDARRAIHETATRARAHNGGVTGSLSFQPDPEVQGFVRLGSEVDDLRSGRSERELTWGVGAVWTPTPRTLLRADYDRRFFGRSYALNFSHRTARTIWTLGAARSLQTGGVGGRAIVSAYDLFFAQFASIEPDPARRDALVRNFLTANGIDPTSQVVVGGFLTSGPTVQTSQNAALAYQGLRHTLMFTVMRSRTEQLGATGAGGTAGLPAGIAQRSLGINLSHRLTPESSLVVSASQQRTPDAGTAKGNDMVTLVATWSTRLGPSVNASLGLRHTRFSSDARSYDENALIGSMRMQF